MRRRDTGEGGFGLGALGQDLGCEGGAAASPDEGFVFFDGGVHLLLLVGTVLATQQVSIKIGSLP